MKYGNANNRTMWLCAKNNSKYYDVERSDGLQSFPKRFDRKSFGAHRIENVIDCDLLLCFNSGNQFSPTVPAIRMGKKEKMIIMDYVRTTRTARAQPSSPSGRNTKATRNR